MVDLHFYTLFAVQNYLTMLVALFQIIWGESSSYSPLVIDHNAGHFWVFTWAFLGLQAPFGLMEQVIRFLLLPMKFWQTMMLRQKWPQMAKMTQDALER